MIGNSEVHRPLPLTHNAGWLDAAVQDKRPASTRVNDQKRESYRPAPISSRPKTYLGIIEFTDQGMLREEKQFYDVKAFIDDNHKPLVLVIFVHGWNHNASPTDSNLVDFRDTLKKLGEEDQSREILGVYLGWPGNVRMLPYVSYFSRLNAAARVGRVTCTEVMLSLIAHAKMNTVEGQSVARQNVKTIVIGHSMGGLVVERAFLQAMIGYGITNAPTAAQIASVEKSQQTSFEKHSEDRYSAENICEEFQRKVPAARLAASLADVEFKKYGEISAVLRGKRDDLIRDLETTTGLIEPLMKDRERLYNHLDSVANRTSEPELQASLRTLAGLVFHQIEGTDDSIHHILEGLMAWARGPQTKVVATSKGPFRKTAGEYLEGLRKKADKSVVLVAPLNVALDNVISRADEDLRGELSNFFGVFPIPEAELRVGQNLAALVQVFEKEWDAYNQADKAVTDWEKTEKFINLKKKYDTASADLKEIEDKIQLENGKIAASTLAAAEVASVRLELDLVRERPPADLILLINPASEAILAQQMQNAWGEGRGGDLLRKMWRHKDLPWIISISSEADGATRILYPIAMTAARFFRGAARKDEIPLMTHSGPHLPGLKTHDIIEVGPRKQDLKLQPVDNWKKTPLWIVKATKARLRNHNDFFTENFTAVVMLLLKKSEVLDRPEPVLD